MTSWRRTSTGMPPATTPSSGSEDLACVGDGRRARTTGTIGLVSAESAWGDESTRRALRSFVLRACGLVAAGILFYVLAAVELSWTGYPDSGIFSTVAVVLLGLGTVPVVGGLFAIVNSTRMWWTPHRHAWVAWPVRYEEVRILSTPNGQPTLLPGDA